MGCRCRGEGSRCRSRGRSRSCRCCRGAGPYRYRGGGARAGAGVRHRVHRRPWDRRPSCQAGAAGGVRHRACRNRASEIDNFLLVSIQNFITDLGYRSGLANAHFGQVQNHCHQKGPFEFKIKVILI